MPLFMTLRHHPLWARKIRLLRNLERFNGRRGDNRDAASHGTKSTEVEVVGSGIRWAASSLTDPIVQKEGGIGDRISLLLASRSCARHCR